MSATSIKLTFILYINSITSIIQSASFYFLCTQYTLIAVTLLSLRSHADNLDNLAQAMLGSALAWLRLSDPKFVVHIYFSLVQISWHTEFQLPRLTK